MTTELPAIFALRRYRPDITDRFPELSPYKDLAVLIDTTKNSDGTWSFNIIEHPEIILNDSIIKQSYNDKWLSNKVKSILVKNEWSVKLVKIKFNEHIILHSSDEIPLFKMSQPCVTLSHEFFNLYKEENDSFRFEFIPSMISSTKIIEDILAKNETCPVLMVSLTKENIRLTKCGHAFSSSIEKWISEKGTCPICRNKLTISDISRYN